MPKKRQAEDSEGEAISPAIKKAKVKTPTRPTLAKKAVAIVKEEDDEGNIFWELGNKRRIGTSNFRGNTLINIREYYETNGELKPGRKGISLTVDQYRTLLKVIPHLNEELRSAGYELADPDMSAPGPAQGDASLAAPAKGKTPKKAKKANIEVTSDEEEGSD